jgi:hypothetical protein
MTESPAAFSGDASPGAMSVSSDVGMGRPVLTRKTSTYSPTDSDWGDSVWRDKTASDVVRETPGTLVVEVLAGRNLIARDMVGLFRSKKSDPFVVVSVDGKKQSFY